ncbi:hypothetical protein GN956_G5221 [Arapaima gigas]
MDQQDKQVLDPRVYEGISTGLQPPENSTEPAFHQHLHRLFGRETAEYFLNPGLVKTPAVPWLQQWMASVGDQVSGEELWDTLRENSKARLMKMDAGGPQVALQVENIAAMNAHKSGRSHLERLTQVRLMFQCAQLHQAKATLLLAENPLPQLSDSWEFGGSHRYLPSVRNTQKRPGRHPATFKQGKLI